jgi:murein DD-endopeptidase MepM/ murein hydrolase activator NlpD
MLKAGTGIALIFIVLFFTACRTGLDAQQRTARQLQKGTITEDTSYVYQLPFLPGKKYWVAQGYFSIFSHKNRAALDFKMKKGTTIVAARSGVVLRLKEDGNRGGWNKKNRPYGNYIIIQHSDGSRAGYWHLQYNSILPNVGDTVQQGQPIGKSGKTGYALFPHLHFLAWRNPGGTQQVGWQPIGTRFATHKGITYLRPGRFYKKPHPTP